MAQDRDGTFSGRYSGSFTVLNNEASTNVAVTLDTTGTGTTTSTTPAS